MYRLVKKIGLGLALTCGISGLALAQVPDTSKIDKAKTDAQQAAGAATEGTQTAKEGAAGAKETAGAVQKADVQGATEGGTKTTTKAKSTKTSAKKSSKKAQDTAKDVTGK